MEAKKLSELLKARGVSIGQVTEPDDAEDGMIVISKRVHVQVPFWGNEPNVVRVTIDEAFIFGDPRSSFDQLVADINAALAAEKLDEDASKRGS